MIASILTAGLDAYHIRMLDDKFSNDHNNLINHIDLNDLAEHLHEINPVLTIIGIQGREFKNELPFIRRIRSIYPDLPIVLINKYGSEERAVEMFRAGINDYFRVPIAIEELYKCVARFIKKNQAAQTGDHLDIEKTIIGGSKTMRKLKAHLLNMACFDSTVLITGETGTGKELAAEMIHRFSPRSKKQFVCINCSAIPENLVESDLFGHRKGAFTGAFLSQKGKFLLADGGTLFLDEIGDMNPVSQAKILRSIEETCIYPVGATRAVPVNIRIIAATNQNLEISVEKGMFRKDLYYRLNVGRIHLPPLRKRKEDIPELVDRKIRMLNNRYQHHVDGLSREAMTMLIHYDWPGNVRELNNCVEHAFIKCQSKQVEFRDLPPAYLKKLSYATHTPITDRDRLLVMLASTGGNKSEAAKRLQWSRMRVYRTLKRS